MNLLLIAAVILLVIKMISGYKIGMVKEIITLITLIFTCTTAALIANGLNQYTSGHLLNVVIVVILLVLLGAVHAVLKPIFFSAKFISKLPIVSWVDKVLGLVTGIVETILLLWTLYFFVMIMDLGGIGDLILQYTKDSSILLWFFKHNYLAMVLEKVSESISFLPNLL